MKHYLPALVISLTCDTLYAQQIKQPSQLAQELNPAQIRLEKPSERPISYEQDCPIPTIPTLREGFLWPSLELGISLPLSEDRWGFRFYTRYQCVGRTNP